MAINLNVLVQALGGQKQTSKVIPKKSETVDVSGKSSGVAQVRGTPLNEFIGLIGFRPKSGKWYTVPGQTYDDFLELIDSSLTPSNEEGTGGFGTGSVIGSKRYLRGGGKIRERAVEEGRLKAGYTQKGEARKLANAFRKSEAQGKKALEKYIKKIQKKNLGFKDIGLKKLLVKIDIKNLGFLLRLTRGLSIGLATALVLSS